MTSETRTRSPRAPFAPLWPPDDTEESVLGTDLHQTTIGDLRLGINSAARVGLAPGQPVPWRATVQIALLGCLRPDGSSYRTYPDVFVYPRPIEPTSGSLSVQIDGPPALIIEVLSEATYEVELDLARGKGYSYARAGVPEYLALDPTGSILPEGIRAWRLVDGLYRPWLPAADGRWHSETIGIAIGLDGTRAVVFTRAGRRMLGGDEVEPELARKDAEIARRDAEIARVEAENARLRRLLEERAGRQNL
jgi:hypothetical protein